MRALTTNIILLFSVIMYSRIDFRHDLLLFLMPQISNPIMPGERICEIYYRNESNGRKSMVILKYATIVNSIIKIKDVNSNHCNVLVAEWNFLL